MHQFSRFMRWGLGTLLAISATCVWAGSPSFGDIADNLMHPTEFITKVFMIACYAVGIALIFMAFAQYKLHRQNPKTVPLATPIVLLILGILAVLIPYSSTHMFGTPSFSATEQAKAEGRGKEPTLLPLPDISGAKGPTLPLPRSGSDSGPASVAPPPPSSGGHWTDE